MKREEQADIAKAAGAAINEVTNVVEGMHKAIADPIISKTAEVLAKSVGRADQLNIEQISDARDTFGVRANVYRAVRGTSRITTQGTAWLLRQLRDDPESVSIQDSKGGATAIAALTTAFGDNLRLADSSLAPEMTIRANGKKVVPTLSELEAAFPQPSSKIVILVHGLGATEYAWDEGTTNFGGLLAASYGFTPVFVRYNSGANIHQNGADFALLVQLLYDNWPVPVEDIVLIGHSMGGLVVRSACAQIEDILAQNEPEQGGGSTDQLLPWTSVVTQVFYVGSPHRGAPLERVSNKVIDIVAMFDRSAPLAPLLNRRSAGIKDLRFGTLLEAELGEAAKDPESNHRDLADHLDIEPLANAEHHLIVGSKLPATVGKLAESIGDTIVPTSSAKSSADGVNRSDFTGGQVHLVEGVTHIPMINDPRIYAVIDQEIARSESTTGDK